MAGQRSATRGLMMWALSALIACDGGDLSKDGGRNDGKTFRLATSDSVVITTLSNRADLISGDDALVEITLPAAASEDELRVDIDGRDVTSAFSPRSDGRLIGLVEELRVGRNQLTARTAGADPARLTITNAPAGGPVLSGPQATPYFCATPVPEPATQDRPLTNASGLSARAADEQCSIAAEYKFYYRTTSPDCRLGLPDPSPDTRDFLATTVPPPPNVPDNLCFKTYSAGTAPADLATTTTDAGLTLPYIVRVERGTINRGIYDIAVLFDPTRPEWTAISPQPQWNGKLQYLFGGGFGEPRRQARSSQSWTDDNALSRGFMVAANSMTDAERNSNRIVTAETVMMMKERIIERYGPIRYTLAIGGSAGAANANLNASIAPGQIDGMVVSATFPDAETVSIETFDCVLLAGAYQKAAWLKLMRETGLTPRQVADRKAAINGHVDQTGCHGWFNAEEVERHEGNYYRRSIGQFAATGRENAAEQYAGVIREGEKLTNNCELPLGIVYHPEWNPGGVRCAAASWASSIWGRTGGAANQTRDNIGVQYGLAALRSGAITGEEFTLLNEIVGGIDRDGRLVGDRSTADVAAVETAYRSGIVLSGARLSSVAIIDLRGWNDSALITPPGLAAPPEEPIHFVWRSFSIRRRLAYEFGDFGNQAVWRFGRFGLTPPPGLDLAAFLAMDRWLTAIEVSSSSVPIEVKVREARPSYVADFCIPSSDPTQRPRSPGSPACENDPFLKPLGSPRQIAGGPSTENALKCWLRPFDSGDYAGRLTDLQIARLRVIFSTGVCDWTRPSVGHQLAIGPLDFSNGPGGKPLPPPPVSTPVA